MPICSICGKEVPKDEMVDGMCMTCASLIANDEYMDDLL